MDKIVEYRKLNASHNTITRNVNDLSQQTGNIYETAVVIARRANQIGVDLKKELEHKLEVETLSYANDNPEREVFENEEQIELSKQYERVPKPVLLALQEYMDGKFEFHHKGQPAEGEGGVADKPES